MFRSSIYPFSCSALEKKKKRKKKDQTFDKNEKVRIRSRYSRKSRKILSTENLWIAQEYTEMLFVFFLEFHKQAHGDLKSQSWNDNNFFKKKKKKKKKKKTIKNNNKQEMKNRKRKKKRKKKSQWSKRITNNKK